MLKAELTAQGAWLYRHRSYLPLPLITALLVSVSVRDASLAESPLLWDVAALVLGPLGLVIRAYTLGHAPPFTSGGNLRVQAASSLNRTGMYSVVRHPLYLGNLMLWLGVSFLGQSLWISIAAVAAFGLVYERIMLVEEQYLEREFPDSFRDWASQTPALVPRVANWAPPVESFAWRRILRREYNALAAFGSLFVALITLRTWVQTGEAHLTSLTGGVLAVVAIVAVTCLYIKKRTAWLESRESS